MIERDQDLLVRSIVRLKDERGGGQRPVHAGGAVVRGRSPHAMIDPDGWRDVAARDAELAHTLRRVDVNHACLIVAADFCLSGKKSAIDN